MPPPGPLDIKAKVSWLECDTECVLGNGNVAGTLTIGSETKPSADATLIATWQAKLPVIKADLAARAWWEKPATGDTRPIIFEWPTLASAKEPDFYPYASDKFDVSATNESLQADAGKIQLAKIVKKFEGDWPDKVSGLLVQKIGEDTVAFEVSLPIAAERHSRGSRTSRQN